MNKAGLWNFETKTYDSYILPTGATLLESDMDKIVACAGCSKPHVYGRMYTSKRIHTPVGFGYMVCESCYANERLLEQEAN